MHASPITTGNTANRSTPRRPRTRRGSAYFMILVTAMIATMFGVSGIILARVQHRSSTITADWTEADGYAIAALDLGFLTVEQNPVSWRALLAANSGIPISNRAIGRGTCSLVATDPADGNLLNNMTDPVLLTGEGRVGEALFKWQVTLDGSGAPVPGSFRRAVN